MKKGETITLEDGTVVNGQDYISPDIKGRVVTICGDTRKCEASEILAYRSDVLVHEATYEEIKGQQAYRHFHSTSLQAAEVAKNAEVKRLLLTHISARYIGKQSQELEDEAKKDI